MKNIESCANSLVLIHRLSPSSLDFVKLKRVFRILSNETRLRMLHSLIRSKELCVTELAETIGMKPQAISNQLQRMADSGILGSRRDGNNIYYAIIDPCVPELLDRAHCLMETSMRKRKSARVRV